MLVAFEGIDGSGKSTAIRLVAQRLRKRRYPVHVTQEPTTTWMGRNVRKGIRSGMDPLALAGLFLADRGLHVASLVPRLAKGEIVLTDRYRDSTTAYQGAALDGRIPAVLDGLWIIQEVIFPRPDLVVLLDLRPREGLKRIRRRPVREPFEKLRFLERVRRNYLALARRDPARWLVVDARMPRKELADEVAAAVEARAPASIK